MISDHIGYHLVIRNHMNMNRQENGKNRIFFSSMTIHNHQHHRFYLHQFFPPIDAKGYAIKSEKVVALSQRPLIYTL